MDHVADQHVAHTLHYVHTIMLENFANIKRRNEAMLFHNLPSLVSARLGSAVSDIEVMFFPFAYVSLYSIIAAAEFNLP